MGWRQAYNKGGVKSVDIRKLQGFIDSNNIAAGMKKEDLDKIGADAMRGYQIDLESRSDTDKINKEAMKLAKQTYEEKTFPWPNAANIKYPLITVASIQFASRSLPELVPDETIVNVKVIGNDEGGEKEKRGERVSKYMDFQLTEEIDNWMDGTDRLLHALPIVGTCFRKIYYDSLLGRVASKFLTYDDVVVNAKAENLKSARRASHKVRKYNNYVTEMVNAGLWLDHDLGRAPSEDADDDAPHLFIEQHKWLDLDDDGYKEPYIVTVHSETSQVMRVVARYDVDSLVLKAGVLVRIEPIQYFVKYPFIPNPDGGFYDIGFGTLLYPINSSLNTTINQLLDSGTLANTGGGFTARGVKLRAGAMTFKPGEWKPVDVMGGDLRAGILPLPKKEPSQVLFSLLGMLITAGKDISSVQEAMSGQKPGENVSEGTVVALIEQGLKVFSGIYKRIYRSFSEELKLIYRLNSKYLHEEQYIAVLDEKVKREDFNTKGFDISPSADPQFSLDAQRVAKAEALMKISGRPGLNEDEVTKKYLKAIKAPNNVYILPEKRPQPQPSPEMEKIKLERDKFDIEAKEANLRRMKLFAEIEELRARAIQHIAKAEAEEEGLQLESYKTFIENLGTKMKTMRQEDDKTRVRGVEAGSNDAGSL